MRVNQEQYEPLATFSVWDKEHYEIIHEIPLRAQILTVFLSLAIVIFGAIQSAAILGIQIGIVLGLVGLSLLYVVYTIDSSDLINK